MNYLKIGILGASILFGLSSASMSYAARDTSGTNSCQWSLAAEAREKLSRGLYRELRSAKSRSERKGNPFITAFLLIPHESVGAVSEKLQATGAKFGISPSETADGKKYILVTARRGELRHLVNELHLLEWAGLGPRTIDVQRKTAFQEVSNTDTGWLSTGLKNSPDVIISPEATVFLNTGSGARTLDVHFSNDLLRKDAMAALLKLGIRNSEAHETMSGWKSFLTIEGSLEQLRMALNSVSGIDKVRISYFEGFSPEQLEALKKEFEDLYMPISDGMGGVMGGVEGVIGVGASDGVIQVYVVSQDVAKNLPRFFKDIPIEIIVSGAFRPI